MGTYCCVSREEKLDTKELEKELSCGQGAHSTRNESAALLGVGFITPLKNDLDDSMDISTAETLIDVAIFSERGHGTMK